MGKRLITLFFVIGAYSLTAQSPGGVSANLRVWYKAGEGTTSATDNSITYKWDDQSGNAFNAWVSGTPIFKNNLTDNINFNPTIFLDGSSYFDLNDIGIRSNGGTIHNYTIFGIGLREDATNNIIFGDPNNKSGEALALGYSSTNTQAILTHRNGDLTLSGLNAFNSPFLSPFILSGSFNQTSGRTLEEYRNGNYNIVTDANTSVLFGYSGFRVGNSRIGGYGSFDGRVSEVFVYRSILSNLEKLRVLTYLGLKYGITISNDVDGDGITGELISGSIWEGDYVASDGTTIIWDNSAQGSSYFKNVAGIGRDDGSELDQRQSKSRETEALITIGHGSIENVNSLNTNSFGVDKTFMLWANNGGSNTFTSTGAPAGRQILGRSWRISETGTVGTVKIQIPASTSTETFKLPSAGTLDLLVDTDGDFSSGSQAYQLTLNGTNWEADVNFNDGDYFTLAPGGAEIFTSVNGAEGGLISVEFTVILPSATTTGNPFTFDIQDKFTGSATSGLDYVAIPLNAQVSIPNGSSIATYTITIVDDIDPENIETIEVSISNPSGPEFFIGTADATANIYDDDAGPGGIGANLNVWLKANLGTSTTADNTTLSTWSDQSSQNNHAIEDGAPPLYMNNTSDNINFNPTIKFDGFDDRLALDLADIKDGQGNGNGKFTILSVGIRHNGNANVVIGSQNYNYTSKFHYGYLNNGTAHMSFGPDVNITTNNFDNPALTPFLLYGQYNGSGRILEETRDGIFRRNTDAYTSAISSNSANYIGDIQSASYHYNGRISEIIVYDNDMIELDKLKIYTYLAIKYGLRLTNDHDNDGILNEIISGAIKEGDYIDSDGTVIWNYATHGLSYFNDIAGIGRDDASSLQQKQSISSSTDALITMGLDTIISLHSNHPAAFSNDRSFLIWGNNNGSVAFTTTGAPTNREILGRIWKVQKSGTIGKVKLRIPSNSSSLPYKLPYVGSVDLLVDSDGDFTSGANIISMQLVGTNWEADVNFSTGQYFTFSPKGSDLTVNEHGTESGPTHISLLVTLPSVNNTGSPFTFDLTDNLTGTASSGSDYIAIPPGAQISIPNGSSTGTYTITVINDLLPESNESIDLTISNPSSSQYFVGIGDVSAIIYDDDAGPGGVGSNLNVWLKANTGTSTSTNNSALTTWSDQSNEANDAVSVGNPPLFKNNATDNINYNPVIYFDGINSYLSLDLEDIKDGNGSGSGKYTLLGVGIREDGNNNFILGSDGGVSNEGLAFGYTMANNTATLSHHNNDLNLSGLNTFNTPGLSPFILYGENNGSGRILEENRNGNFNRISDNNILNISGTQANYIGYQLTNTEAFLGKISEVIVYENTISALQKQQIYSYLSLKYGISLSPDSDGDGNTNELISGSIREGDYVASDGTTVIWDYLAMGAAYFNDIAGIGRDDASELNQKQSVSSNLDALVAMGLGSISTTNSANNSIFSADKSFLLWGNNNGTLTFSSTGAPANTRILNRSWKVQESGSVGNVRLNVTANNSSKSIKLPATATLNLLVDADGDFSSGAIAYPMALNGTNWVVDVNFTNGNYFTFSADGIILGVSINGSENGPLAMQFTATLPKINTSGSTLTLDVTDLFSGTAQSGQDYIAVPPGSVISIPNGSQSANFSISVIDDGLPEASETVIISISNPSSTEYFIGTAQATATIQDNDVGPGAVGNNLVLWLKANAGTSTLTNNTALGTWFDLSPGVNNATDDGSPPVYKNNTTDNLNFNPAIEFDGLNDRMVVDLQDIRNSNYTLISVGKRKSAGFNAVIGSGGTNDNQDIYYGFRSNNIATFGQTRFSGYLDLTGLSNYDNPATSTFLLSATYNGALRTLEHQRDQNYHFISQSYSNNLGGNRVNYIGDVEVQGNYSGMISEIIIYNTAISALEKLRIHSYLAIKYGLTLTNNNDYDATANEIISGSVREGDYVASDGTTIIWNYAGNGPAYFNDIAGIGRDDESNLDQKQSKSQNSDAIISMGLGSIASSNTANFNVFAADKNYLLWGNDNGLLSATDSASSLPPQSGIADKLQRKWKVVETGSVGTVQLSIPKAQLESFFPYSNRGGNFYVRTDNTESLDLNPQDFILTDTILNAVPVYVCNIDFNGSTFFTILQKDIIIWTGNEWRGGLSTIIPHGPSAAADELQKEFIILPADTAIISEPIAVNTMEIDANASLVVNSGICVNVGSFAVNNGYFLLKADAMGYSQYKGPAAKATFRQYIDSVGWHNISSPFSDALLSDIKFLNNNGRINYPIDGLSTDSCNYCNLWWYDASADNGTDIGFGASTAYGTWRTPNDSNDLFLSTKGWNMFFDTTSNFSSAPWIIEISGTLNDGAIQQDANENNGGWNLVANPYPSDLDWNVIADKLGPAGITNAFYIWDHTSSNYATFAMGSGTLGADQYIAPFQSFFIQTANPGSQNSSNILRNLNLDNGDRPNLCTGGGEFFKTSINEKQIIIQAQLKNHSAKDECILRFNPSATREFKITEDANKLFGTVSNSVSVYFKSAENYITISTQPLPYPKDSILLGIKARHQKQIVLNIKDIPADLFIWLEDLKTGKWYRASQHITFTHDINFSDRFMLHFGTTEIAIPDLSGEPFEAYLTGAGLRIELRSDINKVKWQLHSLNGGIIEHGEINPGDPANFYIKSKGLSNGVYIFKLETETEVYSRKIPIINEG